MMKKDPSQLFTMSAPDEMENASETALICPRCELANPRGRKFCGQCGAALWEACLKCGEVCAVGENFCGSCGANLNEAAAERLEELDASLRKAIEQQAAGNFDEAQSILQSLAKNDHPRLEERAERARRLARQWTTQRRRGTNLAQDAWKDAQQLFSEAKYEVAAKRLAGVPVSLRNEDIVSMQAEIKKRQEQIAALEKELQAAVAEKRLLDLPAAIERLLVLKPDHAHAKKLASQLQSCLTSAANKRAASHRYDEALKLLDALAPLGVSPRSDALRRNVAEAACWVLDIKSAPTIDATLVSVAERFRKAVPGDAATIKRCDELRRQIASPAFSSRIAPAAWSRPPRETALGVPVDWCAAWRRFACGENLNVAELQRAPGRFQTACGLALAALRKSSLRIDLLGGESRGVIGRIANLVRSSDSQPAWGLDFGGSSLKAVQLAWDSKRELPVVQQVVLIEYAKPLAQAFNKVEETRLISETIDAFLRKNPVKGNTVCAGIPGRMAMSRMMDLPPVASNKARSLVEFEARLKVDMPLSQLLWDWGPLNAPAEQPEEQNSTQIGCHALWVAVKRNVAERYFGIFRRLKLRVDMLQPDFIALHNFISHEYFTAAADEAAPPRWPTIAALDVGCDTTNVVVSSPNSLWFHSSGIAGHAFTRTLVREFAWSLTQAEQQKRTPETAERLSDLYQPLTPMFADFLKETQQSLAAYAAVQPDHPVDRVLGLGGGFALHGLFRYLRCGR
jgi:Tfp pilus assembly PilM family ATPase